MPSIFRLCPSTVNRAAIDGLRGDDGLVTELGEWCGVSVYAFAGLDKCHKITKMQRSTVIGKRVLGTFPSKMTTSDLRWAERTADDVDAKITE